MFGLTALRGQWGEGFVSREVLLYCFTSGGLLFCFSFIVANSEPACFVVKEALSARVNLIIFVGDVWCALL